MVFSGFSCRSEHKLYLCLSHCVRLSPSCYTPFVGKLWERIRENPDLWIAHQVPDSCCIRIPRPGSRVVSVSLWLRGIARGCNTKRREDRGVAFRLSLQPDGIRCRSCWTGACLHRQSPRLFQLQTSPFRQKLPDFRNPWSQNCEKHRRGCYIDIVVRLGIVPGAKYQRGVRGTPLAFNTIQEGRLSFPGLNLS